MIRRGVPAGWKGRLEAESIEVLPLVKDISREYHPGWCTYVEGPSESPEVEVICGGVNDKTPIAAAIWRQGNLLHFGFDLSPAEMNERGRALLVNAIAYIARFTEDRPLTNARGGSMLRAAADSIMAKQTPDPSHLT